MARDDSYLNNLIDQAETTGVPHRKGDRYNPHNGQRTDLNVHTLDMLAPPADTDDVFTPKTTQEQA